MIFEDESCKRHLSVGLSVVGLVWGLMQLVFTLTNHRQISSCILYPVSTVLEALLSLCLKVSVSMSLQTFRETVNDLYYFSGI